MKNSNSGRKILTLKPKKVTQSSIEALLYSNNSIDGDVAVRILREKVKALETSHLADDRDACEKNIKHIIAEFLTFHKIDNNVIQGFLRTLDDE